jgi:hypothetical protein
VWEVGGGLTDILEPAHELHEPIEAHAEACQQGLPFQVEVESLEYTYRVEGLGCRV